MFYVDRTSTTLAEKLFERTVHSNFSSAIILVCIALTCDFHTFRDKLYKHRRKAVTKLGYDFGNFRQTHANSVSLGFLDAMFVLNLIQTVREKSCVLFYCKVSVRLLFRVVKHFDLLCFTKKVRKEHK